MKCIDESQGLTYYGIMSEKPATLAQLKFLLSSLPDIVYIIDEKGFFLFLNESISLLGYEPSELLGKHFSSIIFPEDRPNISRDIVVERIRQADKFPDIPPKLFDERRSGDRMTRELEVRLVHKDGHIVYALVNAYGERNLDSPLLIDIAHSTPMTVGVIHDITAMHLYQQSLEESLDAKERLMRETHHRVKTNLQLVASLAHLQQMEVSSDQIEDVIRELEGRIKSIALVHDVLYQAEKVDMVPARSFFTHFCQSAEETLERVGSKMHLHCTVDECALSPDRLVPLALAILELLSGASRAAFKKREDASISLSFTCENNGIKIVELCGAGIGSPPNMSIFEALIKQSGVNFELSNDSKGKERCKMIFYDGL